MELIQSRLGNEFLSKYTRSAFASTVVLGPQPVCRELLLHVELSGSSRTIVVAAALCRIHQQWALMLWWWFINCTFLSWPMDGRNMKHAKKPKSVRCLLFWPISYNTYIRVGVSAFADTWSSSYLYYLDREAGCTQASVELFTHIPVIQWMLSILPITLSGSKKI